MNTSVLLVTAYRWPSSARIGIAFAEAGWQVETLCPRGHFLESTRAVRRCHTLHFLAISSSICRAIARAKPDLIVPCDDLVADHLRKLADPASAASGELRALLERSLGDPSGFADLNSRSRIAALAREEGVTAAETAPVRSVADLEAWVARHELPVVVKADGTSGGYGVRIASTLEEARNAFAALSAPMDLSRAVKRAVVDKNETYLLPALKRTRPVVNVQRYIAGNGEITCTAACRRGEILGYVLLRVLQTTGPVGGSTVVQVIEDPIIFQAVERMARRLRISGLCGFDFMLERETGRPFLLEINPRATPTTHLRTATGSLAFALRPALTGEKAAPVPLYKNGDKIALFPQECLRDPESDFLRTAHRDVPWNEPDFVRACLRPEKSGILRRLLRPDGHVAKLFSRMVKGKPGVLNPGPTL